MNECTAFQNMLLTASPAELRGAGDTPLVQHLARCDACREQARRILALTDALARRLDAPGGAPDVDAILARAEGTSSHRPHRLVRRARGRHLPWLGLAAAAVLAAVLFRPVPRPAVPPAGPKSAFQTDPPLVESTPGNEVAVLPTADPDITILWFF